VKPDLDVVGEIQRYQAAGASAILLDAWHPELKGGTGHNLTGRISSNRYSSDFGRRFNA
jgi:hypothetical protein